MLLMLMKMQTTTTDDPNTTTIRRLLQSLLLVTAAVSAWSVPLMSGMVPRNSNHSIGCQIHGYQISKIVTPTVHCFDETTPYLHTHIQLLHCSSCSSSTTGSSGSGTEWRTPECRTWRSGMPKTAVAVSQPDTGWAKNILAVCFSSVTEF